MRGTGIKKEVEICATNITNKTKCLSTNAMKLGGKSVKTCSIYQNPVILCAIHHRRNPMKSALLLFIGATGVL
jgi:hypothetical protein